MKKSITLSQAVQLIYSTKGKIFTASFTKNNGERRVMNCRLGVTKGVTGKGLKFEPMEHKLIPVYDLQKNSYRMINLKSLDLIKFKGIEYSIIGGIYE